MNETQQLASFVSKLAYEDIPVEVIRKAKELILDQMGCQLAGSTMLWGKAIYEYVKDNGRRKSESTIINYGLRAMAADTAFANANFGHALMADDTDSVCNAHLGAIIIPATLAVAEHEKSSGRELIKAVVAGYEVSSRIGAAAPLAESRGFHPGPIFGPFGVAAGVGTLLEFNEAQMLNALAIAGSQCSGLMEYSSSGGTVNRLHAGIAAYSGIRGANLLAADGMIYSYEDKRGRVSLLKPTDNNIDIVGSFKVKLGKGPHLAHMSIGNGILFVRHGDALMAYDIKRP